MSNPKLATPRHLRASTAFEGDAQHRAVRGYDKPESALYEKEPHKLFDKSVSSLEKGEDALIFIEVRQMSPQWVVELPDGRELARVTQRYLKQPPYVVCFSRGEGLADEEVDCQDRAEVLRLLVARMPREYRQ